MTLDFLLAAEADEPPVPVLHAAGVTGSRSAAPMADVRQLTRLQLGLVHVSSMWVLRQGARLQRIEARLAKGG